MRKTFDETYPFARAPDTPPKHWPRGVQHVSLDGLNLFGLDGRGRLYLDGKRVQMRHRLGRTETLLTVIGLVIAAAAVIPGWLPYLGVFPPAGTH